MFGGSVEVGEVTASAAGHEDLFSGFVGVVQDQRAAAPVPCRQGAHQAGRAGADDDGVEGLGLRH